MLRKSPARPHPRLRSGRPSALHVDLTPCERATLEAWLRSTTIPVGLARRARIILLLEQGRPMTEIAALVPIARHFIYKWAKRFLAHGVDGLADQPRWHGTPETRHALPFSTTEDTL